MKQNHTTSKRKLGDKNLCNLTLGKDICHNSKKIIKIPNWTASRFYKLFWKISDIYNSREKIIMIPHYPAAEMINCTDDFWTERQHDFIRYNQFLFLTLPPRQRHFSFPPETGKVCGEADILEWRRTRTEALGERAPQTDLSWPRVLDDTILVPWPGFILRSWQRKDNFSQLKKFQTLLTVPRGSWSIYCTHVCMCVELWASWRVLAPWGHFHPHVIFSVTLDLHRPLHTRTLW